MKILIIKQTSLGDVLHASGHIRAIKKKYPDSMLSLLTAQTSAEIYKHSPWIDELILIDRYGFKKNWYRKPIWAAKEIRRIMSKIRRDKFDLAIDLQGLTKTVIFLYGVRANRKYVKGDWLGIRGFRNKNLHAIREMDRLLETADIPAQDTSMEITTGNEDKMSIEKILLKINSEKKPLLLASPFSRWPSKDWPLKNYLEVCNRFSKSHIMIFTGSNERSADIDSGISYYHSEGAVNLAGKLSILEFAELIRHATLMLTGDSFAMHLAGAQKLPVVAMFGPTDEKKVGPLGERDKVIRVADCDVCDKQNCPRKCLQRLDVEEVIGAVREFANESE